MKKASNLYKYICNINNIVDMTDKVCKTVRNKKKVDIFENKKIEHIINIYNRLNNKNFKFDKYNIFMITDPKCRIVMAEEIEDKIINHLVAKYILVKTFENKYIDSMVATRKNKGTLYGVKLLKHYLNKMKRKYDNFYFLKLDISKYFYSIDHNILKEILKKKIKDKDALNIIFSIIDSTNKKYINEEIKKLKENRINYLKNTNLNNKDKLIKEVEEIPLYKESKGVGLGSQTSQSIGLIYLYEINHYIKEYLHIKYVINYVDDFVIIHGNKEYLKYCLSKIKVKLEKEYKLKLNPKKTRIDNIKNGIDFLGYRFYIKDDKVILKLRKRNKNNFKKKANNLKLLKKYNYIDEIEFKKQILSYKGLLKWGNCNNLWYKVVEEVC
ncbi:MAG: hypothetical protein IKE90_00035 [Bacilli bacterium]|nr:hypothetical protein [Bacilli bacterium]